jgi:hypothetical protein
MMMLVWKRERERAYVVSRSEGNSLFFPILVRLWREYEYAFDAGLCETSSGGWRRRRSDEEKQQTSFFFAL